MEKLTKEQADTILAYAEKHGRTWKDKLRNDWFTGQDASFPNGFYLRQIRNTLGPRWLKSVSL